MTAESDLDRKSLFVYLHFAQVEKNIFISNDIYYTIPCIYWELSIPKGSVDFTTAQRWGVVIKKKKKQCFKAKQFAVRVQIKKQKRSRNLTIKSSQEQTTNPVRRQYRLMPVRCKTLPPPPTLPSPLPLPYNIRIIVVVV